ncbi:predicted protein [Histoplasma capsulatum var. duboisii H88]|uniref:Predicted protein n=1 Tax=Ajellomyces capsulatus (strain H88) TaxID=544711 RepID=F0UJD9_AJEC8|nr:predicted protein [Histoplasma capsulatum var. duboisii H88]
MSPVPAIPTSYQTTDRSAISGTTNKYKKSHLCRNPMRQKSTDSGFDDSISLPSQNHTQYSLTDTVSSSSSLLPLPIDLHINTIGNTIRTWVPFGCLTKVTCCLNYTTTAALIVWQDDSRGFNYMPAEIDSLVEHLLAHDSHRSSYMLVSAIESLPCDAQLTRGLHTMSMLDNTQTLVWC